MNWRIDEPVDDFGPDTPPGPVTSLHQVIATLRRRWRTWVGLGVVGMLAGIAWTVHVPPQSQASVTLLLAHPTGVDPASAMATDMSILRTRTLAEKVIADRHLSLTPAQLQGSIAAVPATSTVLELTLKAPDDAAAIDITNSLSTLYLSFRADQLSRQARALEQGYQQRIDALNKQVDSLTQQYTRLSHGSPDERAEAGDILTLRSQYTTQITTLQQSIEESQIGTTSVIQASHILDPAHLLAVRPKRREALTGASGLVGGLGIGILVVLVPTLLSTRLRRREDIADTIGTSVVYSVPRVRGRPRAARGRLVLANGIATACQDARAAQGGKGKVSIAVSTVDRTARVAPVVAQAAAGLAAEGHTVLIVDLSEKGGVAAAVDRLRSEDGASPPLVFRPEGRFPELTRGPLGGSSAELDETARDAWRDADTVITLAPLDLDTGIDELASWATGVVLVVTAGRTGAERLRSLGDLVRTAGLQVLGALLIGVDRTDETLGRRANPIGTEARQASS